MGLSKRQPMMSSPDRYSPMDRKESMHSNGMSGGAAMYSTKLGKRQFTNTMQSERMGGDLMKTTMKRSYLDQNIASGSLMGMQRTRY